MRRPGSYARWTGLGAALVILGAAGLAAAQKNPTSKLYVADLTGDAEIDNGERIEPLNEKSVYTAEGTVIETKPGASNAMVFSNGTGVYFAPETRLEVQRFSQAPFAPNRADIEYEPSISQTQAFLPRGTIGLCTARMVPGSTMVYQTPLGSLQIREGKVLIESSDYETRISLVEGDITVRAGEADAAGQTLQPGQQAIIRQRPGQPPEFLIQPIPQAERDVVEEQVAMACMARRTVYFDVADRTEDPNAEGAPGGVFTGDDAPAQEIVVVPVTPIELPVDVVDENTTSPSFISGEGQG